jgi:hypothetical protein
VLAEPKPVAILRRFEDNAVKLAGRCPASASADVPGEERERKGASRETTRNDLSA